MKSFESLFNERANGGLDVLHDQFVTQQGADKFQDFIVLRTWDGTQIENSFFELLQDIVVFRDLFLPIMEERMAADEQLMKWISAEVGEG